jgi:hypothetical protein
MKLRAIALASVLAFRPANSAPQRVFLAVMQATDGYLCGARDEQRDRGTRDAGEPR